MTIETPPDGFEPLLGLATTRQLLEELKARGHMAALDDADDGHCTAALNLEAIATELLEVDLPAAMLDYRTVS